jgi:hypothetical protein
VSGPIGAIMEKKRLRTEKSRDKKTVPAWITMMHFNHPDEWGFIA